MQEAAVGAVFAVTLAGVHLRPFGMRDWQAAGAGALAAWVVGPLWFGDGLDVLRDSWNILAFFLGLMLIAAGADACGLYSRVAALLGRHGGRGQVVVLVLAGTAITAVLSNDATPLVLTPAIYVVARGNVLAAMPAAFAATFVADGASLLLPASNPVNLFYYEHFDLELSGYLREITPAGLAGVTALAIVLAWRGVRLPGYTAETQRAEVNAAAQRGAIFIVVALGAGYIAAAAVSAPLGVVTLAGGVAFLALSSASGQITPRYWRHVSPGVLIFVAGLLLLVESVAAAGLLDPAREVYVRLAEQPAWVTLAGTVLAAAVLSNLVNNWPAALVLATIIAGQDPAAQRELITGTLIGCTIGANFTIMGSLSTVFWLNLARGQGAIISPMAYARAAFAPTAVALVAAWGMAVLTIG
ncbi:MAG: ArsB/NhaD family transporter [Dehalococcoidia bacterium]|nr:ArsB/NhaD family transporter [Dehalococcoidia bacterium]